MSAERSAWLVVAFVVVLVLTMQVLKRRYDALLLGTAMLPFLGAGLGVWVVAACRLGEPDSAWARWTYRGAKADRAVERWYLALDLPAGDVVGWSIEQFARRLVDTVPHLIGNPARRRDDVVPEHRPDPSPGATRAVWLLGAATVLAAVAGSAVLLVAGVLLPNAVLLRAGRPSAARVVDVLAVAGGAAEVVRLLASGPGTVGAVLSVASLLALAAGVALLRRRECLRPTAEQRHRVVGRCPSGQPHGVVRQEGAAVSLDLLIPVAVTFVLIGVWAFPAVVLLKQKYVLFVVGLVLVAGAVLTANGAGILSIAVAVAGVAVWVVAAVRLAPPASRWAKQLYGATKAAKARERPAGAATREFEKRSKSGAPEPAPTPAPPRTLILGAVATVLGLVVVGAIGGVAGGIAPGAALPVLWLVRAGWRRGRTIVTVLAVLAVANTVYNLTADGAAPLPFWIAFAVGVLLLGGGTLLLFRDPAAAHLRAASR